MGAVLADRFPDGFDCCVLESVDVVGLFGITYYCCLLMTFVLTVLSVGISGGQTRSSVCVPGLPG